MVERRQWEVSDKTNFCFLGYTVVSTDAVGQMPLINIIWEGPGIHLALLGGGGKGVLFSGMFWV